MAQKIKILVAAGGTGGHLFPALAVVEQLQKLCGNDCEFHFVGTEGKIETRVVPPLGFNLHLLNLGGITKSIRTLAVPFQVLASIAKVRKIIKNHSISLVLGAGAYLTFPPGIAAGMCGIPLVLMESNVNPGKAIKMLASRATKIIATFDETIGFFPNDISSKILVLGNPVRGQILNLPNKLEARIKLNLPTDKHFVFVFGGSLGARSINNAMKSHLDSLSKMDVEFIWQTGKNFDIPNNLPSNVRALRFIDDMASHYAAADLVVARSGATTVAELAIAAKPSVLVPLPSASNNEQMQNAKLFAKFNAAIYVDDSKIGENFDVRINELLADSSMLEKMGKAANSFAKPDAALETAREILKLINYKRD